MNTSHRPFISRTGNPSLLGLMARRALGFLPKSSVSQLSACFSMLVFGLLGSTAMAQLPTLPWTSLNGKILQNGQAFGTCHASTVVANPADRYVLVIKDTRTFPSNFSGGIYPTYTNLWNPPVYHHASWTLDQLGNVFGTTHDSNGNLYVTAIGQVSAPLWGGIPGFGQLGGYNPSTPWDTASIASGGVVYKIDAVTGVPSVFATLPQQQLPVTTNGFHAPGLGQIAFDPFHNQFFVSNFEDGTIYRLSMTGTILSQFTPGAINTAPGMPPAADVVWALAVGPGGDRLYFSKGQRNVRSVALSPSGAFLPVPDRAEFTVNGPPVLPGALQTWISDLSFDSIGSQLLVSERTMDGNFHTVYNHNAISYLYSVQGSGAYALNRSIQVGDDRESYGGGAFGPLSVNTTTGQPTGQDQMLWFTSADILDGVGPHGFEAVPVSNLSFLASGVVNGFNGSQSEYTAHRGHIYVIDYDGILNSDSKGSGGDIDIAGGGLEGVPYNPSPCPTITISPNPLPQGMVGMPYNQTLTASGGAPGYTWTSTTLPTGLILNSSTGVLNGTPTATGTATITVTDINGCFNVITLTVVESTCPPITISPNPLPVADVNVFYDETLTASGGTPSYFWTAVSLPTGMTLDESTGQLSGVPEDVGVFTITVTDRNNCTSTIAFVVNGKGCPTLTVSPNPAPNGFVGVPYNQLLTAAGGSAPYTWSATGLPGGMSVNASTGQLSGTPSTTGTASILVTDNAGCVAATSFTVLAAPSCPPVKISPSVIPNGIVGVAYSQSLSASAGTPPYTWSSTPLPTGLSLNASTGLLSGTPTTTGSATITVIDVNGCTGSLPFKVSDPIITICITPDPKAPEIINIIFTRDPDITGIDYCIERSSDLGNPTSWGEIPIDITSFPINILADGTEEITITDIEALTGMAEGKGYVRLIAKDNGNPIKTSAVQGWQETPLGLCCQTYNVPFRRCALFTGTVSSVKEQDLVFTGENLSGLLADDVSYYAEVISGDNAGQRFDIVSAAGTSVTLASDSDLCSAQPPFNTLTGAPPASLAGDTIVIHPHWTLREVFPPAGFGATNDQTTADQIQIHAGGTWKIYWLYANSGDPIWADTADPGLNDLGGTALPPGQGVFFNNRTAAVNVLGYGEVRENTFIRPLCAGLNLVGGGYPVTESTALRGMTNSNFFGSTNFSTADNILIWNNDANQSNTNNYTTRWLLNHTNPFKRWVKIGDSTFTAEDANLIFPGNRASFIRRATARPTFSYPATWAP